MFERNSCIIATIIVQDLDIGSSLFPSSLCNPIAHMDIGIDTHFYRALIVSRKRHSYQFLLLYHFSYSTYIVPNDTGETRQEKHSHGI